MCVWAAFGVDEDEWLRNSCFLFSSHFSSSDGEVWDAAPLLTGRTSPSWCFYWEASTARRFYPGCTPDKSTR